MNSGNNTSVQIKGYQVSRFLPDQISTLFVKTTSPQSKHPEAEALLSVIAAMEMPLDLVNVKPGQKVILPRSKVMSTRVRYAGGTPFFAPEDDQFGAIEVVIPEGTVIEVVFSNTDDIHDEQMKVFTTL